MPKIPNTGRARALRRSQTGAELELWRHLRNRQLAGYKFKRQVPRGPYIVDFLCDDAKLVVELDGGQHALQVAYDAHRTAVLEADGYRVLRFWNIEVTENLDGVIDAIYRAVTSKRRPGPSP